jgi:hypothetical protein
VFEEVGLSVHIEASLSTGVATPPWRSRRVR